MPGKPNIIIPSQAQSTGEIFDKMKKVAIDNGLIPMIIILEDPRSHQPVEMLNNQTTEQSSITLLSVVLGKLMYNEQQKTNLIKPA